MECQNAKRQRRVFERAFRKNKSLENKSKYYAACKHANEVYVIEREKYFKEKLANHKSNARAMLIVVNQLLDKVSGKKIIRLSQVTSKHVNLLSILVLRLNKLMVTYLTKIVRHLILI